VTKYIRYRAGSSTGYAVLDGDTVHPFSGDLFGSRTPTGAILQLSAVTLLAPCQPGKILAVGLNYKSHLGGRPQPTRPEIFYKAVTALQDPGGPIVTLVTLPICTTKANSSPSSAKQCGMPRPAKPATPFSASPAATT